MNEIPTSLAFSWGAVYEHSAELRDKINNDPAFITAMLAQLSKGMQNDFCMDLASSGFEAICANDMAFEDKAGVVVEGGPLTPLILLNPEEVMSCNGRNLLLKKLTGGTFKNPHGWGVKDLPWVRKTSTGEVDWEYHGGGRVLPDGVFPMRDEDPKADRFNYLIISLPVIWRTVDLIKIGEGMANN